MAGGPDADVDSDTEYSKYLRESLRKENFYRGRNWIHIFSTIFFHITMTDVNTEANSAAVHTVQQQESGFEYLMPYFHVFLGVMEESILSLTRH